VLRVNELSKHFGGLKAVDKVSLELNAGEILGVIGPNGAGKTTLFSLIAGSLPPTSGEVTLEGRRISGQPAHRVVHAGVVRTHQIVRPFLNLSVLENATVGAMFGAERREPRRRAQEALELVGLANRAAQLPAGLTLADRKKLELARALATGPRVLLLDEVIAGVNPAEAKEMAILIRRIRDERKLSIILIEHVMPAVMSLCERVVVLDAGKEIASGTPAEVTSNPAVIAAYLGTA
jgi:branched-chain amino acid transport system ATP-binding protein